jgi:hypothetical protein
MCADQRKRLQDSSGFLRSLTIVKSHAFRALAKLRELVPDAGLDIEGAAR